MRFEHQGLSLWYGTADAPAPAVALRAGADAVVTVAVLPASASNQVEVAFRVNGGRIDAVPAKWLRNDPETGAQYFSATLPPLLQPGDRVRLHADLPLRGAAAGALVGRCIAARVLLRGRGAADA